MGEAANRGLPETGGRSPDAEAVLACLDRASTRVDTSVDDEAPLLRAASGHPQGQPEWVSEMSDPARTIHPPVLSNSVWDGVYVHTNAFARSVFCCPTTCFPVEVLRCTLGMCLGHPFRRIRQQAIRQ